MSDKLHEKWLGEVVASWDCVWKLNTFEERYLAWILLLRDETLMKETKYLASHFCYFSEIMLRRNWEYILWYQLPPIFSFMTFNLTFESYLTKR